MPRVRRHDAQAARALGLFPRLQSIPEVSWHPLHAHWRDLPEGWGRDRRAAVEEAGEGVLRLFELPQLRFRLLGQARAGEMPGMWLPRRGDEVEQDPGRVPEVRQVR